MKCKHLIILGLFHVELPSGQNCKLSDILVPAEAVTALWDILGSEPFKGSKGHRQVSTTSCPAPRTLIDAQPEMKIVDVCPLLQLPGSCQVSPTTPSGSKYPALPLQPSFFLASRGILLQDLCLALLLSVLSPVSPVIKKLSEAVYSVPLASEPLVLRSLPLPPVQSFGQPGAPAEQLEICVAVYGQSEE